MPNSPRGGKAPVGERPIGIASNGRLPGSLTLRLASLLLCILVVFLLPYLFPSPSGISMSSMAGLNNRIAVLALLLCSAALGVSTGGFGLHLGPLLPPSPSRGRWLLFLSLLLASALAVAIWLRARVSSPVAEAAYFLDRYAMHRMGYHIFRDISFDYGPLMFFPAVWLAALFHLTPGDGNYLWWLLDWVAGVALLWWTVQNLPAPPRHRTCLFLFALAMLLPLLGTSGLNYTPLRYILAPSAALAVYRILGRSRAGAAAFALLAEAVLLAFSPEQGISFALATIVFFAVCVRRRSIVLPATFFLCGTALVFALALHFGLLQSLLNFGGGGYDMPLLFRTSTVVLITLLLLAGSIAIGAFLDKREDRPELYLIAMSLFLTPAALGRADAGHLLVNTLPAIMIALLVLWRTPRARYVGVALACILAIPAVGQLGGALYAIFGPHVATHLRQLAHQPSATVDAQAPERARIQALLGSGPQRQIFAPFGYSQPTAQATPLPIYTGRLAGYGLVSDRFPQLKIAELQARNDTFLLVPPRFDAACAVPSAKWLHDVLHLVLDSWYTPSMKHTTQVPMALCAYIHQNFDPSKQASPVEGWALYERIPPGSNSARSSR